MNTDQPPAPVQYKLSSVTVDGKPSGNHLRLKVDRIPSGERTHAALNFTTTSSEVRHELSIRLVLARCLSRGTTRFLLAGYLPLWMGGVARYGGKVKSENDGKDRKHIRQQFPSPSTDHYAISEESSPGTEFLFIAPRTCSDHIWSH